MFETLLYLVIYGGAAFVVYTIYIRSKKRKGLEQPASPIAAGGKTSKFALPSLKLPLSKKAPPPAPDEPSSADVALARFKAMTSAQAEKAAAPPAWVNAPPKARPDQTDPDIEDTGTIRPAAQSTPALAAPTPAAPATSPRIGVVLRRQVPPKSGAPRSWLGGLPMMPEHLDWPNGAQKPLHFVAQIACEDLPADLWNGIGPRSGWLLFFLNPNDHLEAKSTFRVLHTPELGEERAAPEGLSPVNDGTFADYDHDFMPRADKPSVWMRWPVDIVEVPAELYDDEGRTGATPPDFAAQLYPDTEIMADGSRYSTQPFAIGCLIDPLRLAVEKLRAPDPAPYEKQAAKDLERLEQIGGPQRLVAEKVERIEKSRKNLMALEEQAADPGHDPALGGRIQYLASHITQEEAELTQLQQIVEEHPTSDAFVGFLRNQHAQILAWRSEAADELASLAARWSGTPPETALSAGEAEQFMADMKNLGHDRWILRSGGEGRALAENVRVSAEDYLKNTIGRASTHFAVAAYLGSQPALLGEDRLARIEPWMRRLSKNMPHRMGGYHDGIQSDAGPQPVELLLQLACDDPLHWTWGDSGGVYFWIKREALAKNRFDETDCLLESC